MTYVARAKTAWVPWNPHENPGGDQVPDTFYTGDMAVSAGESWVSPANEDTLSKYEEWLGIGGT